MAEQCGCVVRERLPTADLDAMDRHQALGLDELDSDCEITYCPMHKAAPDWRTALERIIVIGEEASAAHGGYLPMLNRMAAIAAEAVAQARGQPQAVSDG